MEIASFVETMVRLLLPVFLGVAFFDICILDTILYQVLTATLHYIPDSALYLQSEEIATMSATFGCFVEDTHC